MIFYYPLVVEAAIEFKRFVRRYLAEYHGLGNEYVETDSARVVELAKGYKLAYHVDGKYYCLKDGQELKDRLEILKDHKYKPAIVQVENKNVNQGSQGDAQEEGPRWIVQDSSGQ